MSDDDCNFEGVILAFSGHIYKGKFLSADEKGNVMMENCKVYYLNNRIVEIENVMIRYSNIRRFSLADVTKGDELFDFFNAKNISEEFENTERLLREKYFKGWWSESDKRKMTNEEKTDREGATGGVLPNDEKRPTNKSGLRTKRGLRTRKTPTNKGRRTR
ncbi:hypothetical protein Anas_05249 [Armadillidium nasatum]|uniref:Sm domain-containing protein n=1 Tax=Armadillidium nasatum TaxID=96803 RepID=A0A5N5T6K8_9CRUS|nr:hypothetical protein Anas_05249 [Armadillidium nasatum]